jgi:hypothetical protein
MPGFMTDASARRGQAHRRGRAPADAVGRLRPAAVAIGAVAARRTELTAV